jgi:hypothetical protein
MVTGVTPSSNLPPMTGEEDQGVRLTGKAAIQALADAGLIKGDASGNPIYPLIPTSPQGLLQVGGNKVTIETGRVPGTNPGDPTYVSTQSGHVAGVAYKTNPDGSISDLQVVLNATKESDFQPLPPPKTP